MKKIFAIAVVAILAACGGQAKAQMLDQTFKDSNGNSFTLDGLRSVEFPSGSYKLTHTGESFGLTYADSSNAVSVKVKNSTGFNSQFIQVLASQRYINSREARRVYCDSGQTKIIWKAGPEEYIVGDGCAFNTTYQGRAQ